MKELMENRKVIDLECDCMDIDHMIRFMYFEEDGSDDMSDGWLYADSALNANIPFFRRLVLGLKYIFRIGSQYHALFGETVLLPSDARDLIQFLQKYNDYVERNNLFH